MNSRRVLTSIKKFTDCTNQTLFLGSDSMYGSTIMDGKFKIFSLQNLTDSVNNQLADIHSVETIGGCHDSEYFCFPGASTDSQKQEYIVTGLDDGSLHIYDYSANKGKSSQKNAVFKVSKEGAADLDNPDSVYLESMYEHDDIVQCIEKNFRDEKLFLTAGKDS